MPAAEIRRAFVPFGDLRPDEKLFGNDGLVTAFNVVPIHGNYMASPRFQTIGTGEPADEALGLHTHFGGGTAWYGYLGSVTALYELSSAGAITDKTRAAGGAYTTGAAQTDVGWQGASFGDAVVMTNYVDDPQLLTSPAAANFAKLASSGGGSAGMDPKAKFVFPVRNNLFLANLNLGSGFDTLSSGANPTVVAWSQTDNVRQYGSFNVTPQLTGTGYQPLSYDFGHITGGIGGEYGLIALQRGWVRADGPPYVFRPIVSGEGCRYPNSIIRYGTDVYYWGPAGPMVLRGGEGPPESITRGRVARTLIDNTSGFSPTYSIYSSANVRHVSGAGDPINGLIWWSFTSTAGNAHTGGARVGDTTVVYNIAEERFAFFDNVALEEVVYTYNADGSQATATAAGPYNQGVLFLQQRPDLGAAWAPGRDIVGIAKYLDFPTTRYRMASAGFATGALFPVLARGYQQLDENRTTRISRVRPVYSRSSDSSTLVVYLTVYSKNKPYETALTSASNVYQRDGNGWIATPDSKFADFHQIQMQVTGPSPSTVAEFEGYEVEWMVGGSHAAAP